MNPLMSWAALSVAIVCELAGTTFLQRSDHITKLAPTLISAGFYAVSFYMLAQALRTLPLGVAYAIWGGVGIVFTAAIGVIMFKQRLEWIGMVGIAMIVGGGVLINAFSKSAGTKIRMSEL